MNPLVAAQDVIHSVFLYAAFTGKGLVKVGISRVPYERVATIHMNSPYPIKAAMWAWVGDLNAGRAIERDLKALWKSRNTRGEWYEFDYDQDKAEFHGAMNGVFAKNCRRKAEWTKHGSDEIKAMVRNKAKLEAPVKKKMGTLLTRFRTEV